MPSPFLRYCTVYSTCVLTIGTFMMLDGLGTVTYNQNKIYNKLHTVETELQKLNTK